MVQFATLSEAAYALFLEKNKEVMEEIQVGLEAKRQGVEDELFDALYRVYAGALIRPTAQAALDKALNLVRDQARTQANTLARNLTEAQLNAVGRRIAEGLERQIGPKEIARTLEEVTTLTNQQYASLSKLEAWATETLGPDRAAALLDREKIRMLRKRKRVIAQTEARYATEYARRENAKERGAKWKTWITVGDNRVSQMDQDNEAAGVLPIDAKFPSGHTEPPSHPRCRCSVSYVTSDRGKRIAEELTRQRIERTAAAQEAPPREARVEQLSLRFRVQTRSGATP